MIRTALSVVPYWNLKFLLAIPILLLPTSHVFSQDLRDVVEAYNETLQTQFDVFSAEPAPVVDDGKFDIFPEEIRTGSRPPNKMLPLRGWVHHSHLSTMMYLRPGQRENERFRSDFFDRYLDITEHSKTNLTTIRFLPLSAGEAIQALVLECSWIEGQITDIMEIVRYASIPLKSLDTNGITSWIGFPPSKLGRCFSKKQLNLIIRRQLDFVPYCFYIKCKRHRSNQHLLYDVVLPIALFGTEQHDRRDEVLSNFYLAFFYTDFSKSGTNVIMKDIREIVREVRRKPACSDYRIKPSLC